MGQTTPYKSSFCEGRDEAEEEGHVMLSKNILVFISFMVFYFIGRFLIHLGLIFMYDIKYIWGPVFAYDHPVFPVLFIENTFFSPLGCLCTFGAFI